MLHSILLIALSCSAYVLSSTAGPRYWFNKRAIRVLADVQNRQRVCGPQPSQERIQRAEAHFDGLRSNASLKKENTYTVAVHWHVVSRNSTVRGGNIPCVKLCRLFVQDADYCVSDSQITDQMQVLNDAYASSGVSFQLAGTTRTVNETWFGKAEPYRQVEPTPRQAYLPILTSSTQQNEMKAALRKGGAAALNIYSVG